MATQHMGQERRNKADEALCGAKVNENLVWTRDGITCWKCVHLVLGRPIPPEPECREHDKLKAAKSEGRDATQLIGEFLEWLGNNDGMRYVIASWHDDELFERHGSKEELIADFFGINQAALDAEKDALLEYQRAYNKAIDWVEKEGIPFLAKNP